MKKIVLISAVALLVVVAGGLTAAKLASVWPFASSTPDSEPVEVAIADGDFRYVPLDKLIVMLRDSEHGTRSRYLAMDLVFKVATPKQEKQIRDKLPLLRATAHRVLSEYSVEQIRRMNVDEIVAVLKREYIHAYGSAQRLPFADLFIGKLMVD
ncbi:flagellar basal body-associated FliL family protein [Paraburkholderia bonniea]|uniref:flagellar basal body-associated FliL family protein n=1 Tax=Paraburkholderia bonniea TaxID=2152891 RepID=UPI0012922E96|nr:flagellar basal body-associated FliL family protein [Paraburkholderia bonniea]WJF90781.1 flagellar basal body-associated FliL family protein [Paraburkholderia bonniea]WJF94095.1 flagellar basal body-associated FliL family protein [Paraburkholderia bonniea]